MEYSFLLVRAADERPLYSPDYQALLRVMVWFAKPDADLGNKRLGFVHGWTGEFGYVSRDGLVAALRAVGKRYLDGRTGRAIRIRVSSIDTDVSSPQELEEAIGRLCAQQ